MVLLIPDINEILYKLDVEFKFQYGSTDTIPVAILPININTFKFQYGSTDTVLIFLFIVSLHVI